MLLVLTHLSNSPSNALQDFSSTWDIRATPTFFFLKNGQQIDKLVGANRPELEKKVQAIGDGS
jgi:thioredoxin 1